LHQTIIFGNKKKGIRIENSCFMLYHNVKMFEEGSFLKKRLPIFSIVLYNVVT